MSISTLNPKGDAFVAARRHLLDILFDPNNWSQTQEYKGTFSKLQSNIFYDMNVVYAYLERKHPGIFSNPEKNAGFNQLMLKVLRNEESTSKTPPAFRSSVGTNEYDFIMESMIASMLAWRVNTNCSDEKKEQIRDQVNKLSISTETASETYPDQTNGWLVFSFQGPLPEFKALLQDKCFFRKKNHPSRLAITCAEECAITQQILSQMTKVMQNSHTGAFHAYFNHIIDDISKEIGRYAQKLANQKAEEQLKAQQVFEAEQAEKAEQAKHVCVGKSENLVIWVFELGGSPLDWKNTNGRYWKFYFTSAGDGPTKDFPFVDGDEVLLPENMTVDLLNKIEITTVNGEKSFQMNNQRWEEDWKSCFTRKLISSPPAPPARPAQKIKAPSRPKTSPVLVSKPSLAANLAAVSDDEDAFSADF
jgi:hypothetical protein